MTAPEGTTVAICLEPLDVLFFRDGRPFGAATRASTDLPQPQTLAGALGTALLRQHECKFDDLADQVNRGQPLRDAIGAACGEAWIADVQVRGPWLARRGAGRQSGLEVLVPMPAVLHEIKGDKRKAAGTAPLRRLHPLDRKTALPGWQPPEPGMRPLWGRWAETTELARGYLGRDGLEAFLAGQDVVSDQIVPSSDLFAHDHRTGIKVQPDQLTCEEGQIYMASFLALKPGVCLYAEVSIPDGHADALDGISTVPFGGEGRRVAVRRYTAASPWPGAVACAGRKPLLLLTTPGLFDRGWKPACLNGHPAAAAVPGSVAVSGWDLARGGPKPARFAAAAGSVYFLETLPPSLPDTLSDREDDGRQGWGCYLQGVWDE